MLDEKQRSWLLEGIRLFNAGKHWHAHEEWEHLWLSLEGEDKRFTQGLIMAAAMLVQHKKGIWRGVENHHRNATQRLAPHLPAKWGIDITGLLAQLNDCLAAPDADASKVQIISGGATDTL